MPYFSHQMGDDCPLGVLPSLHHRTPLVVKVGDEREDTKEGRTEREVEWFILKTIYNNGGEGPSFDTIVAFGSHSAIPHHQNTNRKLKKVHVILIDMGVSYSQYCSDMTRTIAISYISEGAKSE